MTHTCAVENREAARKKKLESINFQNITLNYATGNIHGTALNSTEQVSNSEHEFELFQLHCGERILPKLQWHVDLCAGKQEIHDKSSKQNKNLSDTWDFPS